MEVEFQEKKCSSPPGESIPQEYKGKKLIHICEVCGKRELLMPEEGFQAGWDYPPYMYPFGVVSPRTCPSCTIGKTAWWAIAANHKHFDELTQGQQETILRIHGEPESLLPSESEEGI